MEIQRRLIFAVIFAVLALLYIIGFSAPYWTVMPQENLHAGPWKVCLHGECEPYPVTTDWMQAVQAMLCLGLVGIIAASVTFAFSFLYVHSEWPRRGACVATIAAGSFSLIGMIVYYAKQVEVLQAADGWALVLLCVVSGLLVVLGAAIGCLGLRKSVDLSR